MLSRSRGIMLSTEPIGIILVWGGGIHGHYLPLVFFSCVVLILL